MDRIRIRAAALTAAAALFAVACGGPSGGSTSETLATDQTLRFALQNDVTHLDPGQVDAAVDITFLYNVFDGLVRYDEHLKIVPDAAQSMPDVSSDGLTYTFKLRKDVKFSNSFAASEVQSKAVAAGLPADVVNFSIDTDMDRLVQGGLVDKRPPGRVDQVSRRLHVPQPLGVDDPIGVRMQCGLANDAIGNAGAIDTL